MKSHIWEFNDEAEVFFAKLSFFADEYKWFPPFWSVYDYTYRRKSDNRFVLSRGRGRYRFSVIGKIDEQPSGIKITIKNSISDYVGMALVLIFLVAMYLITPDSMNFFNIILFVVFGGWFLFCIINGFLGKLPEKIIAMMNEICNQ